MTTERLIVCQIRAPVQYRLHKCDSSITAITLNHKQQNANEVLMPMKVKLTTYYLSFFLNNIVI